ncbi:hypothetical protein GUJ44_13565 [Enterococcus faecalis]|uniref:LPXTG cell wall anchor domain-containing protein n=1 Tax=Enterococcus faecalis TaxID=1351 RepID=UPI001368395E|nr:LPXTG cell wall anchor domain-containing protein [Enterococcus faecalis]NAA43306.1 hypothetical protein [Enterococcus faecalis]NAA62204.1 hypothetical protein [Enterococcus faecalis]NAB66123.1 hypothetical protein [Enterococcus faecalis]NAB86226.1 hypothetical protein [Enterococcus faecalis]NAB89075.1 hypothetical protein [Enterococcus faecalis]
MLKKNKILSISLFICFLIWVCACIKTQSAEAETYQVPVQYEVTFNGAENIQIPNEYKKIAKQNFIENKKVLPSTGEVDNYRYTVYGSIILVASFIYLILIRYMKGGKYYHV